MTKKIEDDYIKWEKKKENFNKESVSTRKNWTNILELIK